MYIRKIRWQWFRSESHFRWFISTVALLAIAIAFQIGGRDAREFMLFMAVIHGIVTITAIRETNFGRKETELHSIDCIWFNPGVAILYMLLRLYM